LSVDYDFFRGIDEKIVELSKDVKILNQISWPASAQDEFLQSWKNGNPKIPKVDLAYKDYSELLRQLENLYHSIDTQHPVGKYLFKTAESYYFGLQMLSSIGTPMFTTYSKILYGEPSDELKGSAESHIEAARHFVEISDTFKFDANFYSAQVVYTSADVKAFLESEVRRAFKLDEIEIRLDPTLASKAAAGAKRIRIRDQSMFTQNEVDQLLHHEVFTHTLTALNGRAQPILRSFGLGSPRTTPSQEGLATFSELITGSIDLHRLKRISLRIQAIEMALSGANFIDVFKFFLDTGETELESYNSTMRIFRGGNGEGGVVFTKDCSYLNGLLAVHTFFSKQLHQNHLDAAEILFAGRMTTEDALELYPFVREGLIEKPKYIPSWFRNYQSLAANLAFTLFASKIDVQDA
jgi:uncharacterized protein (TIGR02421 family)